MDILKCEDPGLNCEEFLSLVKDLVRKFNLLPYAWLKAPGLVFITFHMYMQYCVKTKTKTGAKSKIKVEKKNKVQII